MKENTNSKDFSQTHDNHCTLIVALNVKLENADIAKTGVILFKTMKMLMKTQHDYTNNGIIYMRKGFFTI